MKRSTDRILTSHTGSLPQPDGLVAIKFAHGAVLRCERRPGDLLRDMSNRKERKGRKKESAAGSSFFAPFAPFAFFAVTPLPALEQT